MFCSTCGIGLAATKPSFLVWCHVAGDDAVEILAQADIAEIGADIHRVPPCRPTEARGVLEPHVGIFRRHSQDMRVEIAEGGREEQRRAVEVDHRFHRLLDVDGLGDVLFLDDGDTGHRLDRGGAFGMGLVVAEIVLGADIDEADGQAVAGAPSRQGAERRAHGERGGALQKAAAGKGVRMGGSPRVWRRRARIAVTLMSAER
jgi:hypothetical protein